MEAAPTHNNGSGNGSAELSGGDSEFDAAIKLNRPSTTATWAADDRLQQSRYDAAIRDLRGAKSPDTGGMFLLGNACEMKGESQRAIDAYKAALQVAPGFAEAKARLDAWLASRGTSQ